jgi:hypothetical protein
MLVRQFLRVARRKDAVLVVFVEVEAGEKPTGIRGLCAATRHQHRQFTDFPGGDLLQVLA